MSGIINQLQFQIKGKVLCFHVKTEGFKIPFQTLNRTLLSKIGFRVVEIITRLFQASMSLKLDSFYVFSHQSGCKTSQMILTMNVNIFILRNYLIESHQELAVTHSFLHRHFGNIC